MTNETKCSKRQTQSEIAFKLGQLMIANVKDAFKTFDSISISKYLKIANTSLDVDKESIN